jgi:hypothetical protein
MKPPLLITVLLAVPPNDTLSAVAAHDADIRAENERVDRRAAR